MNREKHLDAVEARCAALCKLAKKRTAGRWYVWPTHWAGGSGSVKVDGHNTIWIDSSSGELFRFKTADGGRVTEQMYDNARFIMECCKSAIAGWKSTLITIRKIRALQKFYFETLGQYNYGQVLDPILDEIIKNWPPESLLE
jgi:hypothetical protein